jgi:hypothetical protein
MSQRDVVAELRAARVTAPPEVRERVRLIAAAGAAPPRRRITWRRSLVVVVPVAAAIAAAVVLNRPAHNPSGTETLLQRQAAPAVRQRAASPGAPIAVPGAANRLQRYGASLTLRVHGVSDTVKRALQIVGSYGGYPVSVHVSTARAGGYADLVAKVPRTDVQQAIARLAQLGTIVAEQVDVQDLQAGVNAADRTIARLQRQLAALRAQPQTPATTRQIAALTARVVALQRARAATVRAAHYATVDLALTTSAPTPVRQHHHRGPLHGLGVAFRWLGIGLVYALALGAPAALVVALVWGAARLIRRRRVESLLSRP